MPISVALATYNGARFLGDQLQSIADQSVRPAELVACDDASGDGSWEILQEFGEKAPFPVRLLSNEKRLGYTKNFEQAFALCGGEIIVPADQDDVWYPHKLQKLAEVLASGGGPGLVFSDADLIDEQGRPLGKTLWQRHRFSGIGQKALRTDPFPTLLKGPVVTGMTMAFRAEFLPQILPIPENWHHDAWIALLLSLLTPIEPVPERLCAYRIHDDQQTYVPISGKVSRAARRERAERFREAARRYEAAGQLFLSRLGNGNLPARALAALQGKVRHKKLRAAVYSRRIAGHLILGELIRGGYHRFASGWSGVLGDLLHLANPRPQDY